MENEDRWWKEYAWLSGILVVIIVISIGMVSMLSSATAQTITSECVERDVVAHGKTCHILRCNVGNGNETTATLWCEDATDGGHR